MNQEIRKISFEIILFRIRVTKTSKIIDTKQFQILISTLYTHVYGLRLLDHK